MMYDVLITMLSIEVNVFKWVNECMYICLHVTCS